MTASRAGGTERLRVSSVGPEALLPAFGFQRWAGVGVAPTAPQWQDVDLGLPLTPGSQAKGYEDSCPDAVFRNSVMQTGGALPYQPQFEIGCESFAANESDVKVATLENDYLRVSVMPTGGKIWDIYDKKAKKHLLYNPPALQPGINAYRPWGPGGMEPVTSHLCIPPQYSWRRSRPLRARCSGSVSWRVFFFLSIFSMKSIILA